jgi:hypothetical protein
VPDGGTFLKAETSSPASKSLLLDRRAQLQYSKGILGRSGHRR